MVSEYSQKIAQNAKDAKFEEEKHRANKAYEEAYAIAIDLPPCN